MFSMSFHQEEERPPGPVGCGKTGALQPRSAQKMREKQGGGCDGDREHKGSVF